MTWMAPLLYGCILAVSWTRMNKRFLLSMGVLCIGLTGIGLFRLSVLFPTYNRQGMPLSEARDLFQQIEQRAPANTIFFVTNSLWLLSEDYGRLRPFSPDLPEAYQKQNVPSVVFLQQNYLPFRQAPDAMGNLVREKNWFRTGKPSLFSVPLAGTIPGYQFAVYVPKELEPDGQSPW